jgi:hypothetical protein
VLLATLAIAGCGGATKTTTGSSASTAASGGTAPTTTASATDCNTLGINPTGMREGTCTHAGITYVIVDENHLLKLHTLSAQLSGIRSAASLGGSQPPTPQGKFLVLSVRFTNHMSLLQSLDRAGTQQAGLILVGTVYKEDVSAEKGSDPNSCLNRGQSIAPNGSVTCDVIFAVPANSVTGLGKHGSGDLYVVDFGSDLAASNAPQTVGQVRLYH